MVDEGYNITKAHTHTHKKMKGGKREREERKTVITGVCGSKRILPGLKSYKQLDTPLPPFSFKN